MHLIFWLAVAVILYIYAGYPDASRAGGGNDVMPSNDPWTFHAHPSGKAVRRRDCLEGSLVRGFVGWSLSGAGLRSSWLYVTLTWLKRGVRLLLIGDGAAYPHSLLIG